MDDNSSSFLTIARAVAMKWRAGGYPNSGYNGHQALKWLDEAVIGHDRAAFDVPSMVGLMFRFQAVYEAAGIVLEQWHQGAYGPVLGGRACTVMPQLDLAIHQVSAVDMALLDALRGAVKDGLAAGVLRPEIQAALAEAGIIKNQPVAL